MFSFLLDDVHLVPCYFPCQVKTGKYGHRSSSMYNSDILTEGKTEYFLLAQVERRGRILPSTGRCAYFWATVVWGMGPSDWQGWTMCWPLWVGMWWWRGTAYITESSVLQSWGVEKESCYPKKRYERQACAHIVYGKWKHYYFPMLEIIHHPPT